MNPALLDRPAARGGLGVRGRAVVTVRTRHGRILTRRVFDNLETQYALNSIAAWLTGGGGVLAPAAPSYLALGIGPTNLLNANQADLENTPLGWQASSNCTLAQSSAQAWQGIYSVAITASSAASMTATTTPGASAAPVVAGNQYFAAAHFMAATAGRQVGVNIAWYDTNGNPLSTTVGATTADATTGWTRVGCVATAPAGAAYAAVQAAVTSPGNGEVHYLDGAQLSYAPDGPMPWQDGWSPAAGAWQPVTPTVNDAQLAQERYLTRAQIDNGYVNGALAVLLHTYQQTDPAGSFLEAGLWDQPASSSGYISANANAGDKTLTVGGATPAVAAGTQLYIPAAPLPAPQAPTFSGASTSGGFLTGGQTYYYKITALDSYGETIAGAEASYAVPAGTNTNQITLTWNAVPGATGYRVYRGTVSNGELLLATLNPQTTTTYIDSTNTTPAGSPPTVDTSGSQGEYATVAAAAAAGATSWTLTDQLLYPHPARIVSGTTTVNAPVVAMVGNLWAHVALTSVSKTGTQLMTLQWEITVANAT